MGMVHKEMANPDEWSSLVGIICPFPEYYLQVVLDASFCTQTVLSLKKQVYHAHGGPVLDCKDQRYGRFYHDRENYRTVSKLVRVRNDKDKHFPYVMP